MGFIVYTALQAGQYTLVKASTEQERRVQHEQGVCHDRACDGRCASLPTPRTLPRCLSKWQFNRRRAEVGSLFIGVLIGTVVCGDGQSNWYKSVQLITAYVIIALMFYFIPATGH
jgi:hypothetical protein